MRTILALLFASFLLNAQVPAPWDSHDRTAALGKALANEFTRHVQLLQNADVTAYVEAIGNRLAPYLPYGGFEYTFNVIAESSAPDRMHTPTAIPGGYVFVPASLITQAKNDSEVAGMIAHAMAHLSANHFVRMSAGSPPFGSLVFTQWDWNIQLVSRGLAARIAPKEVEADRLAAAALKSAGYDSSGVATYIARVKPEGRPISAPLLEARLENLSALGAGPGFVAPASPVFLKIQQETRAALTAAQSASDDADGPPRLHRDPSLYRPGEKH